MSSFEISQLAIPSVTVLITFLSYSSQFLFLYLEPGPLNQGEVIKFNTLVVCIWICYYRACFTDPGRVPTNWEPETIAGAVKNGKPKADGLKRQRWCRRCEVFKPPRAHHCRTCRRCVPKMDHHCPWTANCVSHYTFPHFLRFLFYAVASMIYLDYFLYIRGSIVWSNRHMPSYLGPTLPQLFHLIVIVVLNFVVLFTLVVLLLRSLWILAGNQTTIEGWEIARHKTLLRRARVLGGYLDGPDGKKIRIQRQEFPYDIGIWQNLKAGMGGSGNILSWFWPFSATPEQGTGLDFEVNGFEDESLSWPPLDPDRTHRYIRDHNAKDNLLFDNQANFNDDEVAAFRQRQQADQQRYRPESDVYRRRPFHKRYASYKTDGSMSEVSEDEDENSSNSGEEGWRDSEGDRLHDFGVDEEAEFYDEDDIPLAQLIQRRRGRPEI